MHRFYVPFETLAAAEILLPAEIAHQVVRVLRLRVGEPIVLFAGDGAEYEVVIDAITGKQVRVLPRERRTPDRDLPCALEMGVAVLKGEKLEWTVQKLTELGATTITLLQTERTVSTAGEERWSKRIERLRRVAREAAEQCGAVRVPEVHEPCGLDVLLARPDEPAGSRLILDPYAAEPLAACLRPYPARLTILIGPEGGFSPAEVQRARDAGVRPVLLGRRVLRAETASLAAAAVVAAAAES
ncbi:MAG: rRNA ((1498)-N(3))-methyltransferase [Armatimonadetes bacterium]|nr:rRNA ((1498)-N(3))-methyltransferase [Armatimonadota bacterium]